MNPKNATDQSLRRQLRRSQRRRKWQAFALTLPALLLLLSIFVVPIASTLIFAVASTELAEDMPRLTQELRDWDGAQLPDEPVYAALAADLAQGHKNKSIAGVGTRLNYERSGYRSLIMRSASKAETLMPPYKAALIEADERWADLEYWRAMKMAARPITPRYLLQAVDLEQHWDGSITQVPPARAVYLPYLMRTFSIAFLVTGLCVALGFPLAYFIAHTGPFIGRLTLAAVLLPFWTSVLVRMAAWMVVLQKEGIVNDGLLALGLIGEPLQLVFNRFGLSIAMVHVLLPFMVLPIYSAMHKIPRIRVQAAKSLGATPLRAFLQVYVPETLPGLSAGCLLVFILSLGYYITPALIGGPGDQMLSALITQFALEIGNWGMASAVSLLLLTSTIAAYLLFNRLLGAKAFEV